MCVNAEMEDGRLWTRVCSDMHVEDEAATQMHSSKYLAKYFAGIILLNDNNSIG